MVNTLGQTERRRYSDELLKFTFPAIFEQFLVRVSAIAGAAFLGQIGAAQLSASSLSSTIMTMIEALLMGFSLGITVVTARFITDRNKADRVASAGFAVEMALSLVIMVLCYVFSGNVISALFSSAEQKVKMYTAKYLSISVLASPFMALDYTCSALMRASGDSRTPFYITLMSNCVNIAGVFLSLNFFGFDYRSAAVCFVLSAVISGLVKFAVIASGKYRRYKLRFCRFDKSELLQLSKLSLPVMLERFLIQFAFLGIQMVTTLLGTTVLAGYQAANNVVNFTYTITGGFEIALVSLVGRYKYRDKQAAWQMVKSSYKYAYLFTVIAGCIFFIFADGFVRIFASEKEVIEEAARILRLLVLTIPLTTGFQAGIGALKTGSDVKYSLGINVISPNFIRIPIAFVLVKFAHFGFIGLYIGCALDYLIRALIVIWRIIKKDWLNKEA